MMKLIVLLGSSLLLTLPAFSAESMQCAYDAETLMSFENIEDSVPFGLWKGEVQDTSASFQFYLDQRNDKISVFRTFGAYKNHTNIGICMLGERTFITEEKEFFEYYLKNGKLLISDEEFDTDSPEDRSKFKFNTLKPAKIVEIVKKPAKIIKKPAKIVKKPAKIVKKPLLR